MDIKKHSRLWFCGAFFLALILSVPPGALLADANDSTALVAAVPANYPPQYSLNAQGQPTGFAIEVMDEVAKLAGVTIRYKVETTWPETIRALREGEVDLIPNLGISEDRKAVFAFSIPVETFPISIFVRRANQSITGLESLEGQKVAAIAGNVSLDMLRRQPKVQLTVFLGVEQALFALLSGDVEAVVYPEPWMKKLADEVGVDDRIKVVGKPLMEVKRAIAVQKDNRELLAKLNTAIEALQATPKYRSIYTHWYGRPAPYWTIERISTIFAAVAGGVILLILLWHYRSTVALNRRLETTTRQQEQMQAALTESEARYRTLATVSPVGILQADATGHVHYVNEGWQELAGISLAAAQGLNWLNAVHPDDRAKLQQEWLTAVQQRRSFTAEYRFRRPNGKTSWVLGRTVAEKNAAGDVVGFVGSITDINERKRVEAALQESEARWRVLTENSPDHVMMLDREGRIVFINRTEPGFTPDSVLGTVAADYLPEGHRQLMRERVEQVFRTAKPISIEVQRRDLDGVHRYFETVIAPLRDDERVKSVIAYARDITERKAIQQQLHQQQERLEDIVKYRTRDLEASHRELENFSYSISHDLRAPLRRIEGFGKALMEDYADDLDENARDYVERMREGARQMSRLIEDMLQLSRITRADLNHDWVDISKLATSLANRLQDQDPARKAEIDIEPGLRAVADKNLIGIALSALLDNAWKFTRNAPVTRISVGMAKVGEREAYFVRDNGAGFDMAYANKLFAPFQRLHSEAEFPGGGMGLAMVARIIHRHGGEVWGHGEPGHGACFYFTLGKHAADEEGPDQEEGMAVEEQREKATGQA